MNRSLILFVVGAILCVSAHAAEPSAKLAELRQERDLLEREISKVTPHPLKTDAGFQKLQKEAGDASQAYLKAIDAHPNLKAINTKYAAAVARNSRAISSKDEAARESADAELSKIRELRMETAAKEPDLKSLAKAADETGNAYQTRRKDILLSNPATKEKFEKLQQINDEIQLELKKQS